MNNNITSKPLLLLFFMLLTTVGLHAQRKNCEDYVNRPTKYPFRLEGGGARTMTLSDMEISDFPDSSCHEYIRNENRRMELLLGELRNDIGEDVHILHEDFRVISDNSMPPWRHNIACKHARSIFKYQDGSPKEYAPYYGLIVNTSFEIQAVGMDICDYMDILSERAREGELSNTCWAEPIIDSIRIKSLGSHVVKRETDIDTVKRWYTAYEVTVPIREKVAFYRNALIQDKTISKKIIFNIRVLESKDTLMETTDILDRYTYHAYADEVELISERNKDEQKYCIGATRDSTECIGVPPPDPPSVMVHELYSVEDPIDDILEWTEYVDENRDSVKIRRRGRNIIFEGTSTKWLLANIDTIQVDTMEKINRDTMRLVSEDLLYVRQPSKESCCARQKGWTYLVPGSGFEFFRQRKIKQSYSVNPCNWESDESIEKNKSFPFWTLITGAYAVGLGGTAYHHIQAEDYYDQHLLKTRLEERNALYDEYKKHDDQRAIWGLSTAGLLALNGGYFLVRDIINFKKCKKHFDNPVLKIPVIC
jgi:hypothetical protein